MTCFWDGILAGLRSDDLSLYDLKNKRRETFINFLKNNVSKKHLKSVKWNEEELKEQEIDEHIEAINSYNVNGIGSGHLTSICDSFLLLICSMFKLNINHQYLNNMIKYSYNGEKRGILNVSSNRGHFSFNSRN